MVKNDSFQPIGKRLDNLNKKLKTDHPEDMWVMKDILNAFLLIIESSSSLEQQHIVSKELNRLFDTYEFRYNTILENKKIMTQETLRMQMLAGVITESEYKAIINKEIEDAEKASLNESMIGGIVGIGAINQIPPRAKADYETAFEHFLGGKYGLNEIEGGGMIDFVKQNFDTIKDNFYKAEKDIIINHTDFEDGEDPSTFINFLDNQINNVSTAKDLIDVINDRSIGVDLEGEEASELFDMIKGYASLEEGKEVEEPTNY